MLLKSAANSHSEVSYSMNTDWRLILCERNCKISDIHISYRKRHFPPMNYPLIISFTPINFDWLQFRTHFEVSKQQVDLPFNTSFSWRAKLTPNLQTKVQVALRFELKFVGISQIRVQVHGKSIICPIFYLNRVVK